MQGAGLMSYPPTSHQGAIQVLQLQLLEINIWISYQLMAALFDMKLFKIYYNSFYKQMFYLNFQPLTF